MTLPVPVQMGIPIMGLNRKDALVNMDSRFSPWSVNWDFETQSVRVRPGYRIHCTPDHAVSAPVVGLGTYGSAGAPTSYKLFAYVLSSSGNRKVYNISTGTPSLAYTTAGATADEAFPANYAGRLALVTETAWGNESAVYDGSTWSSWGFTYGGSPIGGRVVVSYKNRVYIFNGGSCYYSSTVGGVTGATTLFDLSSIITGRAEITWAGVFSAPGDNVSQLMLAFGTIDGEVIVYQGDYPGSDTWTIVNRFKLAPPMGYNSAISYRNDLWIMTQNGVVSLRDLFTKGNEGAQEEGLSTNINPIWSKLAATYGGFSYGASVRHAYWPEQNKIFFALKGAVDVDGTASATSSTLFVYNTLTGSWGMHQVGHIDSAGAPLALAYYDNALYMSCGGAVLKLASGIYGDEEYRTPGNLVAHPIRLDSAYTNFNSNSRSKKVKGFEAILATDFSGDAINMIGAADFGRRVSNAARVAFQSGYNIPFYGCGVEGCYAQYRIGGTSITTSSAGLELFSMGAVL